MRLIRVAMSILAAAALGGCGVGLQDAPTAVPDAALPAEAAERPESITPDLDPVELYFVHGDRLLRVQRHVREARLDEALNALAGGPSTDEVQFGIRSAIPPGTSLDATAGDNGVAVVDVSSGFLDVTGEEQIVAIAQVVFTVTAIPGVTSVRFRVGGESIEVPRGDGVLSPTPVSRPDYETIKPPS